MRVENREKVLERMATSLERMATSEDTTLVIRREADGRMRVTSGLLGRQGGVLARSGARGAQRRRGPDAASKPRDYDEWDPPIEPQDSYAQSPAATDEVVEAQHVSLGNTFHDRD